MNKENSIKAPEMKEIRKSLTKRKESSPLPGMVKKNAKLLINTAKLPANPMQKARFTS
jgi:hypothetical protein